MALLTSIIDIDSIQVKSPPFSPEQKASQIEALANTILDLDGLINLPVVQQVSLDNYELISGYLEYYAYLKAREINPRLLDRITVFVANDKNQAAIGQQLEILQTIEKTEQNLNQPITSNQSEVDLRIKNLETSIKNSNNSLVFAAIDRLKVELLAAIETRLPQPIPPLEAFNRILEPEIAFQVQRKLEFLGASTAKKVVAQLQEAKRRKKDQRFKSFTEILDELKVKQEKRGKLVGLVSEKRMLMIIDRWHD